MALCDAPIDFQQAIPLFPLPNAVLLPSAILPLHLFEPRFRDMVRDALAEQRLIAMALLRPGYAAKYYTHHAGIHSVVCVGRIVRHERLRDGRFNILLQGVCRAKVRKEDQERAYRRGWLTPLRASNGLADDDVATIRRRIGDELEAGALRALCVSGVLREVVQCPHLSLSDMIDLLAHNVISEPTHRQRYLAERDVVRRAACLIEMLKCVRRKHEATSDASTMSDGDGEIARGRAEFRRVPSEN